MHSFSFESETERSFLWEQKGSGPSFESENFLPEHVVWLWQPFSFTFLFLPFLFF